MPHNRDAGIPKGSKTSDNAIVALIENHCEGDRGTTTWVVIEGEERGSLSRGETEWRRAVG